MGFNRRKLEADRTAKADALAAARRAADAQVLAVAESLIEAWNERQTKHMPLLFTPTIGAALAARYHFLWVYYPACRTTRDTDLRSLDRHRDAAVTSLIPSLSCRSCQPQPPFVELVRLSKTSIADEMRAERTRRVLGERSPLISPRGASNFSTFWGRRMRWRARIFTRLRPDGIAREKMLPQFSRPRVSTPW
jgi:hypothetical protein